MVVIVLLGALFSKLKPMVEEEYYRSRKQWTFEIQPKIRQSTGNNEIHHEMSATAARKSRPNCRLVQLICCSQICRGFPGIKNFKI
ncbi:hypothetical protein SUGI_0563680 [Cryptomeria japonica]|nr:hypothetical protein SUGI_0563680 [Cryptomeria japonica]